MTIRSQFFDSVGGDRVYNAAEFSVHLSGIYSDGWIVDNDTDGLKVVQNSPTGKTVVVSNGQAFIQGRFVEVFGSTEVLTVPDNTLGATRLDAVFIRVNFVERKAELVYKAGTTVSRPTFTRDNSVWELQLANVDAPNAFTQITQANITDRRNDLFLCSKSKPRTLRQNFQNAGITGWRRIAITNGFFRTTEADRFNAAFANFMIRTHNDTLNRYDHLNVTAGGSIGNPTLVLNSRMRNNSGRNIDGIRIVFDPTFADENVALEVFINASSNLCTFEIYDNYSENGWFPVNWTAGSIPAGFSECKLDFTADDLVMGIATSQSPLNAFGILRDGTIATKGNVRLENNKSLLGKETGGTQRDLIKMNATNNIEIGNANNTTIHPNDLIISTRNKFLQALEIDGVTLRNLIGLNSFNNIAVGTNARLLALLSSGLAPQFFNGVSFFDIHHAGYIKPNGRITQNADQVIANNTVTVVDFNTTRWDTHTLANLTTNRFTITAATKGYYQIFAHVSWAANATGARLVSIRLNGATTIASTQVDEADSAGITVRQSVSTVYQLDAGDFLELVVFQTSGGNLNLQSLGNFSPEFGIAFISPS